jgi:hypothetical protein
VPGELGVDARLDPVLRIGAAVEILGEQRLALGMRQEVPVHGFELLFGLLPIAVPPHRVLGQRVGDGVLVLRRAAGVMAGLGAERAASDDLGFAVADGVLVERSFGQVPVNRAKVLEAKRIGAASGVAQTGFLHGQFLLTPPAEVLPEH